MPTSLGITESPCVVSLITAHHFKVPRATMGRLFRPRLVFTQFYIYKNNQLYIKKSNN